MAGLIARLASKPKPARKAATTPPAPPSIPAGRERVAFVHAELAKAKACVTELEQTVDRLNASIAAGRGADDTLKAAALADFSDDETAIGALRAKAKAEGARLALPDSERQIEAARREVARLTEALSEAALVYLRSEAGNVLSEYRKAWRDLCGHYNAWASLRHSVCATLRRFSQSRRRTSTSIASTATVPVGSFTGASIFPAI